MITPTVEQRERIRQQCPETLLLFREGDQLVAYGPDAVWAAQAPGRTLYELDGVAFAGIPLAEAEAAIAALVAAGHKVAICEQIGSEGRR